MADQLTGFLLNGDLVGHHATLLRNWTRELTAFTNGPATFGREVRQQLVAQGVGLEETPIAELLHAGGQRAALRLADGRHLPLPVLYAAPLPPWHQASALPAQLGCALTGQGLVRVEEQYQTSVPGAFAAGDCCAPLHQLAAAIAAATWPEPCWTGSLSSGPDLLSDPCDAQNRLVPGGAAAGHCRPGAGARPATGALADAVKQLPGRRHGT